MSFKGDHLKLDKSKWNLLSLHQFYIIRNYSEFFFVFNDIHSILTKSSSRIHFCFASLRWDFLLKCHYPIIERHSHHYISISLSNFGGLLGGLFLHLYLIPWKSWTTQNHLWEIEINFSILHLKWDFNHYPPVMDITNSILNG